MRQISTPSSFLTDLSLISREQLLAIIGIQTEIAKVGLDLGAVMALVVERAQQLVGGDGAVIELVEGDEMVYRATSGIAAKQLGLRLQIANSLSGFCIKTGVPQRCDDSELDDRVDREACRVINLRSAVVIPLKYRANCIGVLKVLSSQPASFSPADKALLNLLSEALGAEMFFAVKYAQDELFYRATHDEMTGLPNRSLFLDRLRNLLSQLQRGDRRVAVLVVDMDNLKTINDSYGHAAGDAALCELAKRLSSELRSTDTVARIGGDEFCVILYPVEGLLATQGSVDRLLDSVHKPFHHNGIQLPLSISVGFALAPDDGVDLNELVASADRAMYQAKRAKKTSKPAEQYTAN